MICSSCGTPNRDDAQFCRNCGQSLIDVLHPPSVTDAPTSHLPTPDLSYQPPPPAQPNNPYGYTGYTSPNTPPSNPLANPSYGSYGGQSPPMPSSASGRAVASLIMSIVSFFTCGFLLSIPAMIMGKLEMNAINEGRAPAAGMGYAKAGFWIGLIVTIIYCGLGILGMVFGMIGSVIDAINSGVS